MREDNYIPMYMRRPSEVTKPTAAQTLTERKELFEGVNAFVRKGGGWITSIPGARDVMMECLPGSALPDALREKGYTVEADGQGTRLIPHAITETVVTEGSTRPTYRTTHAGIVSVQRFRFMLP